MDGHEDKFYGTTDRPTAKISYILDAFLIRKLFTKEMDHLSWMVAEEFMNLFLQIDGWAFQLIESLS